MDFGCLFYAWIEFVSLLQEEEDVLVCMKWPCIIEVKTFTVDLCGGDPVFISANCGMSFNTNLKVSYNYL